MRREATVTDKAVTDKAVTKRTKRWAGRGNAIKYRWYERLGDWWCATRDARSGPPATAGPAGASSAAPPPLVLTSPAEGSVESVWGTPRTVLLGQLGRGRAEQEWIRYQAETADMQVARAQAKARGEAARARRETLEEELASLGKQLPESAAMVVAAGEENAPKDVPAGRRKREHAGRRQALRSDIEQNRAAEQEAAVECARLAEQITIRWDVAKVRVAMIEAYVRRRCAAYLTRLVRKHPDGERVGVLLRSAWNEQPSWLGHPAPAQSGGA
jgi:hypothetical protein